jgi:hypothetical protein
VRKRVTHILLSLFGAGTALLIISCEQPGGVTLPVKSSEKEITGFVIENAAEDSIIDGAAGTITVIMPYGVNLQNLAPIITHTGTAVSPPSGAVRNFRDSETYPEIYTVYAEDESTKTYRAAVRTATATEKQITRFTVDGINGSIDETARTITVTLPYGTYIGIVTPAISYRGKSIAPKSGVPQNF